MDSRDWDAPLPFTPPPGTQPQQDKKGKGRATDESPGLSLPQEYSNCFDQRTQDYSPLARPSNPELVPEFIGTCHGHYRDVIAYPATPGGLYDPRYVRFEFLPLRDASSSNKAGRSNQHAAPSFTSGIANLLALHTPGHKGELWGPEFNREAPREGTRLLAVGSSRRVDPMGTSSGGHFVHFAPNQEGNHDNNNIGTDSHLLQLEDNEGNTITSLIHNFHHLPPLRNLTMAHPAKVELPPIKEVLGDVLQSGPISTNSNTANNNGYINPHGAGYQRPEGQSTIGGLEFVDMNGTTHKTGHPTSGRHPTATETERFRNSGHSNGYKSFGDYMSIDMPSANLGHFSIMNQQHIQAQREPNASRVGAAQSGFNIFQAMLGSPDLVLTLARHLRVQELDILYSICKPFHQTVKGSLTSVMLEQARVRAPEGRELFPWRCYSSLCIDDPNGRLHDIPEEAAKGVIRKVPTLRWVKMLCFREMVVHEIMTIMAEDGVGLPDQCETAIKKIWFLMDVPDNRRRNALVQSRDIVTDEDLFYMTFFFVKLDLRFTDPINGGGQDGMRRMLLAQPTLSTLWRVLKRTALVSKIDVIAMFVRWKGELNAEQAQSGQHVLGVPPDEVGMTQYEYWGLRGKREKLEQIEELLMLESVRRELNLDQYYPDMFLWGYVNPNTRENLPPVVRKRRLERLEGLEELLVTQADREKGAVPKQVSKQVIVLE